VSPVHLIDTVSPVHLIDTRKSRERLISLVSARVKLKFDLNVMEKVITL